MIKTLKLTQIHRNESQPREYFDQDALLELTESIKRYGQLQPIVVRPDIEAGGYEIVMGERRYRAFEMIGLTTIQANVISEQNTLELFKQSVAENLNREDMTPLEEARAFQRILDDELGATPETVAAEFGKTLQFVRLRLKLLDLTPEVAKQVELGAIGTQAAVQIAQLTPANQQAVMRKWARGEFAGDNELVHFAYALKAQQDQVFALIVEELTPEQHEERRAERKAKRTTLDRIERVRELLDQIAKADPMQLATALEGEVGARLDQLDRVAKSVADARFQLRQAKAHAEAREIIVNADLSADSDEKVQGDDGPQESVEADDAKETPTVEAERDGETDDAQPDGVKEELAVAA